MRNEGNRPPAQAREPSGELLGPYTLLTELARGELTTVHLAKKQGPLGFQRLVAVKRLRSEYASHESYVRLLVDEARLTAGLHHANLVNVLDVGSEGGCYVVSDYVEGENLERVLVRVGKAAHPRFVLPLLVDALNGLHAVHVACDEDDHPLQIVHQAPCARHILVGVDGVGRLSDFSQVSARGIAPSRVRSERLRLASMAPEQALDPEHVDHRADVFILGITLWEALTGERLFAADTDERTFQNLLHRRIPRPSEIGACPPRSLDAVCMRALEREPAERYATALEMARELRDAALNQALYASPGEIGAWLKKVMGHELTERRRKVGDLPQADVHASVPSRSSEDPYLSGRILGGSSAWPVDDGLLSDPDKTPVRERRQPAPGTYPIQHDDEPTGPRYASFRPAQPEAKRARSSTPPYGAFSEPAPSLAPSAPASGRVLQRPAAQAFGSMPPPAAEPELTDLDVARTERTRVSRPAPASQASGTQQQRPGAYSQVDPSHRRRKSGPPAVPTKPSGFEELDTGRYAGLTSVVPELSAEASKSKSAAPPLFPRKSQPLIETSALAPQRHDSRPSKLPIPTEPVGAVLSSRVPARAEVLPKTFEALRAVSHTELGPISAAPCSPAPTELVPTEALTASSLGSLSPPNLAERTLPPEADDSTPEFRPRGPKWGWSVGATAAAILLATAVHYSSPRASTPASAAVSATDEVQGEVDSAKTPSPVHVTAEPSVASGGLETEPALADVPAGASSGSALAREAAENAAAKPGDSDVDRIAPAEPDSPTTRSTPRAQRVKAQGASIQGGETVISKPKAPRSPIPDNPY